MILRNFRNTAPFSKVKKGHECTIGVVVGIHSKYRLLDSKSSNFLFSGKSGFSRSLALLTIEYLPKVGPNILLFQDCKAYTNLDAELRRYGYCTLYIADENYFNAVNIVSLLSMAAPIAIFINSECVDLAVNQLLSIAINKYDERAAPIPVFVFLPISAAITVKHLISGARGRNIRFIAHGNQLRLEMEECEMFDVMVAETDLHGAKNAIVCKRGYLPIKCKGGADDTHLRLNYLFSSSVH